jgi:hypothetical protein
MTSLRSHAGRPAAGALHRKRPLHTMPAGEAPVAPNSAAGRTLRHPLPLPARASGNEAPPPWHDMRKRIIQVRRPRTTLMDKCPMR